MIKYIHFAAGALFASWLLFAIARIASAVKSGEVQERLDEKQAAMAQSNSTVEITFTKGQLIPRIKNTAFLAAFRQNNVPDEQLPFSQELAGELKEPQAFETDAAFISATPPLLASNICEIDDLSKLASENLQRQLTNVKFGTIGKHDSAAANVFSISIGYHMEPCFLLSYKFWSGKTTEITGKPVAAAPNRDTLMFCDSHSKSSVEVLRALANKQFNPEDSHALSDRLMIWRNNQWHEFYEQDLEEPQPSL